MKIIFPMAGSGQRFLEAGYAHPKPLIRVDGRPMIEHAVKMYPGEHDFIFICNKQHLRTSRLRETLLGIAPRAAILEIKPHKKGPVYTLVPSLSLIVDDEPLVVSYCDFFGLWDFVGFLRGVTERRCDGAVPAYTGFHPHLLHKNLYGGILVGKDQKMTAYKEKHCFTDDPMSSHHSAGNYYFARGREFKNYLREVLERGEPLGGEYYMSMLYYLYLRDKKNIYVPAVDRFLQWGTPEDLEEFEAWSRLFAGRSQRKRGGTDVPSHREHLVKIPHPPHSPEYQKSYHYWQSYFLSLP